MWDWRAVPGRLGFLLTSLPFALAGGIVVFCLIATGTPLLILGPIGAGIIIAGLLCARGFGMIELQRLKWTRTAPIEPTRHLPLTGSWWQKLKAALTDTDDWRAVLHALLNMAVGSFTWSVVLFWALVPFSALWYLVAPLVLPDGWFVDSYGMGDAIASIGHGELVHSPMGHVWDLVLAVLTLVTLPAVTRGLVAIHHALAQALLSRDSQAELRRQVAQLRTQRTAAGAAEEDALRRLERDIHDGPQQQLLRTQMDLDAAKRAMATDPDRAAAMLDEAKERTQSTLDELRALSQGIVHPLLRDRGLGAAVRSIAERSTVPVAVEDQLPADLVVPPATEQGVFLAVTELLANVAKHSGATEATVRLELITSPAGVPAVQVLVADNGRGGARFGDGHGLDGVAQRMQALGGDMRLGSPAGGPTNVWLLAPLTA